MEDPGVMEAAGAEGGLEGGEGAGLSEDAIHAESLPEAGEGGMDGWETKKGLDAVSSPDEAEERGGVDQA